MNEDRGGQSPVYRLVLIVLGVVFLISAVFLVKQLYRKNRVESLSADPNSSLLEYQGRLYVQKEELELLLVMGLDKFDRPEDYDGYVNDQQSDFLALLVLDDGKNVCDVLYLNRDTMATIHRLGVAGDNAGAFTGQLALAHTYGSGGSDSCINAVKSVSELLGGVRIHHYITLTMDAVSTVNDAAGGVTLEVMDDFAHTDPPLTRGQTVTLRGELALEYVRARGSMADPSNLRRMERQQQYLRALYEQVLACQQADGDFLARTLLKVSFTSDCSVNQLDELADKLLTYHLNDGITLAGESVVGEKYMEFYPDEAALEQLVVELFYEPI